MHLIVLNVALFTFVKLPFRKPSRTQLASALAPVQAQACKFGMTKPNNLDLFNGAGASVFPCLGSLAKVGSSLFLIVGRERER